MSYERVGMGAWYDPFGVYDAIARQITEWRMAGGEDDRPQLTRAAEAAIAAREAAGAKEGTIDPHTGQWRPGRICEQPGQITPAVNLGSVAAQDVHRIQMQLCSLGHDVGPVTGTTSHAMFRPAVRSFQRTEGLPVTGRLDIVSLVAMGFSAADAEAMASRLREEPPGGPTPTSLPWALIVGSLAASGLLMYGLFVYMKRKKRSPKP